MWRLVGVALAASLMTALGFLASWPSERAPASLAASFAPPMVVAASCPVTPTPRTVSPSVSRESSRTKAEPTPAAAAAPSHQPPVIPDPLPPADAAPAPVGRGQLVARAERDGCLFFFDGRMRHGNGRVARIDVAAGVHTVTCSRPDGASVKQVMVRPGKIGLASFH